MRTDFTKFHETLAAFAAMARETMSNMLAQANDQRKEMIDLCNRMGDTRDDLAEISDAFFGVGREMLCLAVTSGEVSEAVNDTLECGIDRLPDINYEDVAEFCDECGRAIGSDEEYDVDAGNWVICADCMGTDDEEEDDETDPAQITIDETVE